MPPDNPLADIAHTIQLSVAPVFLLTAVGTLVGVMSTRLGRIVDRSRSLHDRGIPGEGDARAAVEEELKLLVRRRRLVNVAITLCVCAALSVAAVIVCAFVGFLAGWGVSKVVAVLFLCAMAFFMGGLLVFLREVLVASATVDLELRQRTR